MVNYELLFRKAKSSLLSNDKGNYTTPSSLYPFQWAWDSAFIAVGYSTFNTKRAYKELLSLFSHQHKDGFLPHITFRGKNSDYYPSPDIWSFSSSASSSKITQPPVFGYALYKILKNSKKISKKEKKLATALFRKILLLHNYLLTRRDPEGMGLATIIHPWESGMDNSPRWDEILDSLDLKNSMLSYKRTDISFVSASQRPSKKRYDEFIYLVKLMKKHDFNLNSFYKNFPFRVKDVFFNSLLYLSSRALEKCAFILGLDSAIAEENSSKLKKGLRKLIKNDFAFDLNLSDEELISSNSVSTLSSMILDFYPEMPPASYINTFLCGSLFTSESKNSKKFDAINYWRGPIWFNINWIFYESLLKKHRSFSLKLASEMLELVDSRGFYEYYSACDLEPLGSKTFSWTSSLTLDLIESYGNAVAGI